MKQFFLKFWPIVFIVAVWLLFSYPYFVKGKVPYASTYQGNFFPPWSHYQEFAGPVKNNAMPDVQGQIYPWKKFTIDTLRQGQIPLWNPNSFSGNPHLANYQSAVLSPFNLLYFVLPFIDAWSIVVLLSPLLAGIFTYLLLRLFAVSKTAAVLGSVTYMFCGFIVVWMAYGTLSMAIAFLPLALFALESYFTKPKFLPLILLSLSLPLSFFSGHFQISLYFLLTVVAYFLFKAVTTRKHRTASFSLFAIVLGLVLSLPQLLPSIEFYRYAVRSELFQLGEAIPFQYLVTSFAPDFFGNPVTRNDWFGHYAEWASFIGIIPLLLGIYALLKLRNKTVLFFGILAIFSLILAVSSPVSSLIVSLKIPVISTSALSRIIVLFSFAAAILAAFGFDRLLKDIGDKKAMGKIAPLFVVVGGLLAVLWMLLFVGKIYPAEWLIVAKRNLLLPSALFGLSVAAILAGIKKKKLVFIVGFFLLVIATFDSFRFAQKWMPFDPRELVYPDVPVIEGIRENIEYGRIFGNIGSELTSYFGFPTVDGYDPLYIARYGEFVRTAASGEFTKGERSVVRLDRRGKYTDRAMDILGVTLVFHPIPDTNQGWAYPVWDGKNRYEIAYQDDKFQLFRNKEALSRPALFFNYEVISDDKTLLKRFYTEDFDFRNTLLLEEDPGISPMKEGTGSAKMKTYTPGNIEIDVETNSPALLFLSDNYYPGWKATVNGESLKIFRANYSFRAVTVPQGESTVEFTYTSL